MAAESRRSSRLDRRVPVAYTILSNGRVGRALTQNLNADGLRLLLPYTVEVDTQLEIVMEFSERPRPVKMLGRVVWKRWRAAPSGSGASDASEVGVRFMKISDDDRAFLIRYLKALEKENV